MAKQVKKGAVTRRRREKKNIEKGELTEDEYKETFGSWKHPFTGINMIDFYRELIESEDCEVEFVISNDVKTILDYNTDVLTCDIHTIEKSTAPHREAVDFLSCQLSYFFLPQNWPFSFVSIPRNSMIVNGISVLSMTPLNLSAPSPMANRGTNVPEWLPLAHEMSALRSRS